MSNQNILNELFEKSISIYSPSFLCSFSIKKLNKFLLENENFINNYEKNQHETLKKLKIKENR